jgi:hypothetical protein
MTYSNQIDPNLQICPHQLASQPCPDGVDCIYQHFDTMPLAGKLFQSPGHALTFKTQAVGPMCATLTGHDFLNLDDQILLQLGGNSGFDGEKKQQYISGLRDLLYDFRARKIKDFQTISRGIIDYRARFLGDSTKILALGEITI